MTENELMTAADIHAFGVEIVCKQLQEAEWIIESADVFADPLTEPQIVAHKDGKVDVSRLDPRTGQIAAVEMQIMDDGSLHISYRYK